MKDRVPAYPGRVKLVPVSGQPDVFDLERADAPVQEGTPLNKATLLKDSTAENLGLNPANNPTVDDAFRTQVDQIGDIRASVRDLSDKAVSPGTAEWLACDGTAIRKDAYPELSSFLGNRFGLSPVEKVRDATIKIETPQDVGYKVFYMKRITENLIGVFWGTVTSNPNRDTLYYDIYDINTGARTALFSALYNGYTRVYGSSTYSFSYKIVGDHTYLIVGENPRNSYVELFAFSFQNTATTAAELNMRVIHFNVSSTEQVGSAAVSNFYYDEAAQTVSAIYCYVGQNGAEKYGYRVEFNVAADTNRFLSIGAPGNISYGNRTDLVYVSHGYYARVGTAYVWWGTPAKSWEQISANVSNNYYGTVVINDTVWFDSAGQRYKITSEEPGVITATWEKLPFPLKASSVYLNLLNGNGIFAFDDPAQYVLCSILLKDGNGAQWHVVHLDATRSFLEVVADLTTERAASTEFECGILALEPLALNIATYNSTKKLVTWDTLVTVPFLGQLNQEMAYKARETCRNETTTSPVFYIKAKM